MVSGLQKLQIAISTLCWWPGTRPLSLSVILASSCRTRRLLTSQGPRFVSSMSWCIQSLRVGKVAHSPHDLRVLDNLACHIIRLWTSFHGVFDSPRFRCVKNQRWMTIIIWDPQTSQLVSISLDDRVLRIRRGAWAWAWGESCNTTRPPPPAAISSANGRTT